MSSLLPPRELPIDTGAKPELLGIFMKEANLQVPTPAYDGQGGQVDANVQVNVANREAGPDGLFVCALTVTVTATTKADKRLVYVATVTFEGLCRVPGASEAERASTMMTVVPNQLVPYCREAIVSLIARSGHAPFVLPHMQFENRPPEAETGPKTVVH